MKLFVLRDWSVLARCIQYLSTLVLRKEGELLAVYIGPERKLRTRAQNDRLWAIYTAICDATGFDKDDLHEYCKRRFLGVEVKEIFGKRIEITRSTTGLTPQEFGDLMEAVTAMAAEQGIEVFADVREGG